MQDVKSQYSSITETDYTEEVKKLEWLAATVYSMQPDLQEALRSGSTTQQNDIREWLVHAKLLAGTCIKSNFYKLAIYAKEAAKICEKERRMEYKKAVRKKEPDADPSLHDAEDRAFLECAPLREEAFYLNTQYEKANELFDMIKSIEITLSHAVNENNIA